MVKIAFFDIKSYDRDFFAKENEKHKFEFQFIENRLSKRSVKFIEDGTDIVCLFTNDIVDESMVDLLVEKGIKLIALRCAGYNNINLDALRGKISVVRVPEYSPYAVAEHAFALLLDLNRGISRAGRRTREFDFRLHGLLGFDLNGKTVGVVGVGKIGKVFIKIAKGFGMNVIAYDKIQNEDLERGLGFKYVDDIDDIFTKSDVISLHCPLLPSTRHIINEASINKMKNSAVIINTSRGALINTKDLLDALLSENIAAAALDVYEEEADYFFEDCSDSNFLKDPILAQLLGMHNVLVTSHQAFFTKEALHNIAETTLSNVSDFDKNKKLVNEVK